MNLTDLQLQFAQSPTLRLLRAENAPLFQWVESLKPRPHVGTESKFKSLASTLSEIIENATREPDVRIQKLRTEQARLQAQIEEIERTGEVPVYSATQINDAFLTLLVPRTKRNYNMSAGAAKKRERDERTYILGAYLGRERERSADRHHQQICD